MPRYNLLEGVRVVDLSQALSGPFGSQILADLGAEIIKIEAPFVGESTRRTFPQLKGDGYYFMALNRNKKSITLDLQTPTGKRALEELIKVSDVFYTNVRGKAIQKLGLTHDELIRINPTIITAILSGFGISGEYKDRNAFDDVAQAMSGISSLTTDQQGMPVRTAVGSADISAAVYTVIAVIAALYKRNETGLGQRIEVNMLDSCMAFIGQFFQIYFLSGQLPAAMGSKHAAIPGFGFFKCQDGKIAIGPSWPRLARAINREDLIDDPRFIELGDRFKNKDILNVEIEAATMELDTESLSNIFEVEDIPHAVVDDLRHVENNPQVIHNGMICKLEDPHRGEIKVIDSPIKMPGAAELPHQAPPVLGEHTSTVLKDLLGYTDEELDVLQAEAEAHSQELQENSVMRSI